MKRLLSCILALTLVICMVPETVGVAFADETIQAEAAVKEPVQQTLETVQNDTGSTDVTANGEASQDETGAAEPEAGAAQEEPAVTEPGTVAPQEGTTVTEPAVEPAPEDGSTNPEPDQEEPVQPVEPVIQDITEATVTLSRTAFKFTNTEKTPKVVSVTLPDGTVVDPSGYTVKYSKNIKAGTAKVTVKGIKSANVTGKATATFVILEKMDKLTATVRKQKSITLEWAKYTASEIDGYKIFKYSKKKGEYIVIKTIKDPAATSFKVKNLSHTNSYKFKIAPYVYDESTKEDFIGTRSDSASFKTAPKAPSEKEIMTKLYCKAPYVMVKWKNLGSDKANRYQIQYSRDPNFKKATYIITVKGSKSKAKRIYGLRNYTRYYVRIRAGMSYGGQEAYGKWSKASSVVSYSTGWTTYKSRKYYYSSGKALKGTQYINGNPYYFDTKTGELHGCSSLIWKKVKNAKSNTRSIVTIDCAKHRVNVFRKIDGDWVCIKQWVCSSGQTEVNGEYKKTPKGTFKLRYKLKHFGEEKGYTCWYACNFSGHSFIHSVLYNPYSMTSIQDGRLGINASHGCVRLALKNAKWIYENVKKGSTVISING